MSEFENRLRSHRDETIKAFRVPGFRRGVVARKTCTTRGLKTLTRKVSRAHRKALAFEAVFSAIRAEMREVGKANRLEDQACKDFCAAIHRITDKPNGDCEHEWRKYPAQNPRTGIVVEWITMCEKCNARKDGYSHTPGMED